MSDVYTPTKTGTQDGENGGKCASINRPTAGAREDRDLPVGEHLFQLYSLGTPNGQKATILFEELLAAGHKGAEYDAWKIDIMDLDQFTSGFVEINPNSKIPALVDRSGDTPFRVFESGAILLHLAEKFGAFLPSAGAQRAETQSWLMWQMGTAPLLGGGFGHFYAYAPEKYRYPIDRYTMEVKRQLDVLDQHLATREYMAGDYSIADMAIFAWHGQLALGRLYDAADFLQVGTYENVQRWANAIDARPAVRRGLRVNASPERVDGAIAERHSAADLD